MNEEGGVEGCKHSHQVLTYTYPTDWSPVLSQIVLDNSIDCLFQSILTILSLVIVFFPKTSVISEINKCLFPSCCLFLMMDTSPFSGTEFFLDFSDMVSRGYPLIWTADQSVVPCLLRWFLFLFIFSSCVYSWALGFFSPHSVTLKKSHNLMALAFTSAQLFPHVGSRPCLPFLLISVSYLK